MNTKFFSSLLMALLLLALPACQSENTESSTNSKQNTKENQELAEGTQELAEEAKHSNPDVSPVFFYMDDVQAATGETVCLDVKVKNFKQIESNQYSVNWNPKELEFAGIKNIALKAMSQNNFGLNRTAQGNFSVSWYDPTLESVTLPDGASIYQMCFVVKAPSGTKAGIKFSGEPTAIEFSATKGNSKDFFIVGFSARRTHILVK